MRPVSGLARLAAMRTALIMPKRLPVMSLPSTNCAKANPVATVVSSFTTAGPTSGASPTALASMAGPFSARTNRTGGDLDASPWGSL